MTNSGNKLGTYFTELSIIIHLLSIITYLFSSNSECGRVSALPISIGSEVLSDLSLVRLNPASRRLSSFLQITWVFPHTITSAAAD